MVLTESELRRSICSKLRLTLSRMHCKARGSPISIITQITVQGLSLHVCAILTHIDVLGMRMSAVGDAAIPRTVPSRVFERVTLLGPLWKATITSSLSLLPLSELLPLPARKDSSSKFFDASSWQLVMDSSTPSTCCTPESSRAARDVASSPPPAMNDPSVSKVLARFNRDGPSPGPAPPRSASPSKSPESIKRSASCEAGKSSKLFFLSNWLPNGPATEKEVWSWSSWSSIVSW
mmetsp:Transcript_8218/g.15929  ORF Transcript_8218/g.15929 Transcript_8218/m.15929 type:complete len:235 (+) Transcript_8218:2181-2885(+)